ncbi:MAG: sigma-70 family RNA polymerase sigma factor [Lachnospiraceae bacterium]|jgi:RNA polymerase sporulation-specific sigma factor|nr:sigma-70 family RNA polymerase sigma factor [Lachnospiraceae bacterium]
MLQKPLSDEDLIYEIRGGNSDYMDYLLEKYKPLVKSRAATKFLKGGDPDDLIQEGMIGLYKAVRDYDPANEKGASFFTFAQLCIDRQLIKAVEASQRQKRFALNEAVAYEEEELDKYSLAGDENPEQIFLDQENADETISLILDALSRTEKVVFNLMLRGYSYREIAEIMDRSPKSIDNAIQRIRKKTSLVRMRQDHEQ